MFESIINFFKNIGKSDKKENNNSRDTAKERLHLVLMQDRANVSADFLDLMRQEIIEVIKKYVEIDEREIDVRMTNKQNEDGSNGTPLLYANIPIVNIKNDILVEKKKDAETSKVEITNVEIQEQSISENSEVHRENTQSYNRNLSDDISHEEGYSEQNAEFTEENNEPINGENLNETVSQN